MEYPGVFLFMILNINPIRLGVVVVVFGWGVGEARADSNFRQGYNFLRWQPRFRRHI